MVDHEDLDKTNNRIANLRPATEAQNRWNQPKHNRGSAPLKGAYRRKGSNSWECRAGFGGEKHYLGSFPTPEAAHAAYCAFAQQRHGEFFRA